MTVSTLTTDDLPTIEDSLAYVRGNYNDLYPTADGRRKTIGNIPSRLHADIQKFAEDRNLRMFEIVAGMWDLIQEYEVVFAPELAEIRKSVKPRH
tara:strand:+ start:1533 stop:1817 length:285 start_codon:yes stop_codon:yes gene_type:complete